MRNKVALLLFALILGVSTAALAADQLSFAGLQWTPVTDTWQVGSTGLINSAMESNNTYIYAPLDQKGDTLTFDYAFDFFTTDSPTSGPMAGMHLLADDPTNANRGNGLLMWQDKNFLRIYQTTPASLGKRFDIPLTVAPGESHTYRVVVNIKTSEVTVSRDGQLLTTYTTPAPLVAGGYVSIRTNKTIAALKSFSFSSK